MYRILVTGQRSYIVGKDDVLKGGTRRSYPVGGGKREEVELAPGKIIYEITDACYKILKDCTDVMVVEQIKETKKK